MKLEDVLNDARERMEEAERPSGMIDRSGWREALSADGEDLSLADVQGKLSLLRAKHQQYTPSGTTGEPDVTGSVGKR